MDDSAMRSNEYHQHGNTNGGGTVNHNSSTKGDTTVNDNDNTNGGGIVNSHNQSNSGNSKPSFMTRVQSSKFYPTFLQLTRLLQFLSALISLALFSSRVYKVYRLYHKLSASSGAVEGILAVAVAYTILATVLQLCLRTGGAGKSKSKTWMRWLLVTFDVAFVGAFIAVAQQTSPGGPSGPCRAALRGKVQNPFQAQAPGCKLPWGTFVLAILSALLHAITAAFHELKDHHKQHTTKEKRAHLAEPAEERQNGGVRF